LIDFAMARTPYESDITKMVRELLVAKPHIVEEQRKGRALWWDKKLDLDELGRREAAAVKQKGYVYSTEK
jgi:Protein of unknown function (DUF3460)